MVTTNAHLRQVFEQGAELCYPEAALYLRVHEMFPMFHATCDGNPLHGDVEIESKFARHKLRSSVLDALGAYRLGGMIAAGHPVERRNRKSGRFEPLYRRDFPRSSES